MMLNYSYSAASDYAEQLGIYFSHQLVSSFDHDAYNAEMTQEQVDLSIRNHLYHVSILFNPKLYTFKQRVFMAIHFLFGGIKCKKTQ